MSNRFSNACNEYNQLSRRQFIGNAAKAGAALALIPGWLPKVALAQDQVSSRDVMISLFLRGGIDGMTLCVPFGDSYYYKYRPTIAVPRPDSSSKFKALNLNGFFGIPQSMASLLPAYTAGHLLFVHATGGVLTGWSRSHFDAQRWMEVGKPADLSITSGWLGRHLATSTQAKPGAPLRGVGLEYGLSQTMAGGPHSLPIPDPGNYGYQGNWENLSELVAAVQKAYTRMPDPVKSAAAETQQTIALLRAIHFDTYKPGGGAVYPDTEVGRGLKASAALIKADVGVEAISLSAGGWDTHSNQQPLEGYMADLLKDLALSMSAFYADLHAANRLNFVLAAMSEFGRTAKENESQGCDHGTANAMMLMGGNIAGGRVLAKWPGLAPTHLQDEQDLKITIDYRDVLAEVVSKRLGNTQLDAVFPNYTPTFQGVVKA